jgi:DNA replication protein DnaC
MPEQMTLERLTENLTRLRLPRMRSLVPEVIKTAETESWSYLTLLDRLFEEEVAQKEQRRIEGALKLSGLPYVKTIDEFDFAFQAGVNKQQVMNLFDLAFLDRRENLLFLGPPGVGKTHLSVSLAVRACQSGRSIHFTTMAELIQKLKVDRETGRIGKSRRPYQWSSLVVVDEVGYTPIDRDECNLFYQFIAMRYEKASTIITSNKAFDEWSELFHDPVIVTAILDRLLHHSVVVNIKGNSYRLRNKLTEEVPKD